MHEGEKWKWSHSVVSNSLRPHGLQPTRLLHPWDFPGKSTGVGCRRLLWQLPTSQLFYTWYCMNVNTTLSIHPTLSFPYLVSTSLFCTSVSLFLSCKWVHQYHFSRFRMYVLICDICFSLSNLLHSTWQTLGSSNLTITEFFFLFMADFCLQNP